jgi:hypothetical protein
MNKNKLEVIRYLVAFSLEEIGNEDNCKLLKQLTSACHKYIQAIDNYGNSGRLFVCINMSRNAAKCHLGRNKVSSFVFTELTNDGTASSEFWEKEDETKIYKHHDNDYVIKEESGEWEDLSKTEDVFTFIGKKYGYSIPFPVLEEIDQKMKSNICHFLVKIGKEQTFENIDSFLKLAINGVGYTPAMYRHVLTRGLLG